MTSPIQNPRKPFPAWRLPNGVINASDESLGTSIESCERWEWFGGGLVVVGVVATVVIAAFHPRYDSFLEQWGSALADSLVAIGVWFEIKFGQMAGLRLGELSRRSKKELAETQAELARLKKPRTLSEEQCERLKATLSQFAGIEFDAAFAPGDPEARDFCLLLQQVLRLAGWKPVMWIVNGDPSSIRIPASGISLGETSVSGVAIEPHGDSGQKSRTAAADLVSILNAEGIVARTSIGADATSTKTSANHVVHVLVGRKT